MENDTSESCGAILGAFFALLRQGRFLDLGYVGMAGRRWTKWASAHGFRRKIGKAAVK